tara:strand:- start:222 stop:932 length:711 start_codon:yes stop_codon:yes gene_type:complete
MKILKKIADSFGYNLTRKHKSETLKEIFDERVKKNNCDFLIDVGANVGNFFSEYHRSFKKTFIFEPNKHLFTHLKNNFKKFDDIEFYSDGVGNKNEEKTFYITADRDHSLSSIKKHSNEMNKILRNTNIIEEYKINIIKLCDFIKENNFQKNNFFLKVDTQGNDLEVLMGLEEFIKNVKFIKIELPVINLYDTNYTYDDINEFMKNNRFKPLYFEHLSRNKDAELVEYDVLFEKQF